MTYRDQIQILRAAISSLQSALLASLQFLEILAEQSSNPGQFKRQIQCIRDSIQLLEERSPTQDDSNFDP